MESIHANPISTPQAWSTASVEAITPAQISTSQVPAQGVGVQDVPTQSLYQSELARDAFAGGTPAQAAWGQFHGQGQQPVSAQALNEGIGLDSVTGTGKLGAVSATKLASQAPYVVDFAESAVQPQTVTTADEEAASKAAQAAAATAPALMGPVVESNPKVPGTEVVTQPAPAVAQSLPAAAAQPAPRGTQVDMRPQPVQSAPVPATGEDTPSLDRRELERRLLARRAAIDAQARQVPTQRGAQPPELDRAQRELRSKHGGGGSKLTLGPVR